MNMLSWALYLADVSERVALLFALSGMAFVAWPVIYMIANAIEDRKVKAPVGYIATGVVVLVLSCLIPSKNTMYAIAASEFGQSVVESEIGQKAYEALKRWVNSQLKP